MKPLQIGELYARIPVIQGGMGVGVSLSGLAGAVAACGGVGVISAAQIGFREPDFAKHPLEANLRALKKEIQKAKEISRGGIIGVNIMVAMRYYESYVKASIEAGADLIISGAGLPADLPQMAQRAKIKLAPIVSSLKAASVICKLWDKRGQTAPDLVIIEGPEAGGHLGFSRETLAQLTKEAYEEEIRAIIELVKGYGEKYGKKIPVAVAGGIYTREDAKRAAALGADAVQMATRFVTTRECDASDAFKQVYLNVKKEDICLVESPVGMPGRAVSNAFLKAGRKHPPKACYQCLAHCNPKEIPYCITEALVRAVQGDTEHGLIFCGSNAWRSDHLETVSDIMQEFLP